MIILLLLVILSNAEVIFSNDIILNSSYISCPENEKQTLLIFKKDLIDHTNRLASWDPHRHNPDCCNWFGVICDNTTGHVISLNLRLPPGDAETDYQSYRMSRLEGKINSCLSNLKELRYLDLSNNSLEGLLPYQLGNLSNLEYLNLGNHYGEGTSYVENLEWLSGLSLLKHLDLSMVNLSRASNWLHVVNREVPYLQELHLSDCELTGGGASLLNVNLSSLSVLDLSWNRFTNQTIFGLVSKLNSLIFLNLGKNDFDGPIPDFLRNMTSSLRHLDLSGNRFNSSIPDWLYSFNSLHVLSLSDNQLHGGISCAISNMTFLNELDLSWNDELEGKLPRGMGKLCELRSVELSGTRLNQSISNIFEILSGCSSHASFESLGFDSCQLSGQLLDLLRPFKNLKKLSLSNNSISGPIPTSLGQLAILETLDISNNLLEGVVTEKHFASLTKLRYLDGVANSLVLRVHPNWVPHFQLRVLYLGSWKIGPSFPLWLRSQKHLYVLDISNSSISDTIPSWFWGLSTKISFLDLSNNQIFGHVLYPFEGFNFYYLNLSFNNFSGPLPRLLASQGNTGSIDLSNNHFLGSLSPFICYQFNGTMSINVLNLANNRLSGEIPDCWVKWKYLTVLCLDGNRFSGKIPSSMGTLRDLQSLSLHNNMLQGEIPLSLINCTDMVAINLGNNELSGKIPGWLGYGLSGLRVLILRSNKLRGSIPDHLCALSSLQILDLADNNLFGSIPRCINNFTAMVVAAFASMDKDIAYGSISKASIFESASIVMKSQILEYGNTLNLVRLVDFSRNNLSGEIPKEVVSLCGLQSLNLSGNHLTGKIPKNIGAMVSLETLDLSQNQLSGSVPKSISRMTFLSHLNLSFNNFSGRIPTSSQLQGFNESCYAGNHLCGPPLKDCGGTGKEPDVRNGAKGSGKGHEIKWFYVGMPLGFVTGFWCVMGPLVFNRRWRIIYFWFLEEMWWKLCDLCA